MVFHKPSSQIHRHEPAERIFPVVRKRPTFLKPKPPVHGNGRIEAGRAAGFQAQPRVAALARDVEQLGQDGLGGALAQVALGGAHGFEFALAALGGGGGREFFEGADGGQLFAAVGFVTEGFAGRGSWRLAPGGEESDVGLAQGVQIECKNAFGRRFGAHAGEVFFQQVDDLRVGEFAVDANVKRRCRGGWGRRRMNCDSRLVLVFSHGPPCPCVLAFSAFVTIVPAVPGSLGGRAATHTLGSVAQPAGGVFAARRSELCWPLAIRVARSRAW